MENEFLNILKANSNLLIVSITCVFVFCLYYAFPGPRNKDGDRIPKVFPPWDQVLFFAPFVIAVPLSYYFDPHVGQSVKGKLLDGLTTGTYAMVLENFVFKFFLKKLRLDSGGATETPGT